MVALHRCDQCEKGFNLRRSMLSHMKMAHGSEAEKAEFVCKECDKACVTDGLLKRHNRKWHPERTEAQIRTSFEELVNNRSNYMEWKALLKAVSKISNTELGNTSITSHHVTNLTVVIMV